MNALNLSKDARAKLKPCPFCGSVNLRFRDGDIEGWISHVECVDCDDMLGPMSEYKYDDVEDARVDAANVWNRRHDETPSEFNRLMEAQNV